MMKKLLMGLALVAMSAFGTAQAATVVDTENPGGGGSMFSWTHTFTPLSAPTSASIEITHNYLGYYGPGPGGAAALYVDGTFLDYLTDGDSCDNGGCGLYSGTYTDTFSLLSLATLLDGSVTFTIETKYWDSWSLGSSILTVSDDLSPVPVPAAAWLFGTALLGLVGIRRKKLKAA